MRTKRSASMVLGSMVAAGLILCGTAIAAHAAVSVAVGTGSGDPNTTVQITVTMDTGGAGVAGVQNDIVFDPALVNLTKSSDCVINAAIGPNQPGCDDDPQTAPCKTLQRNLAACPAAAGCPEGSDGMMRFRAIILSTANVNTIPDGVLYTCTFKVTGGGGQTATLRNLNFGSSDGAGNALDTTGSDGQIEIPGGGEPTVTPTPEPTEEPCASPAAGEVVVQVGSGSGDPNTTVQIDVSMATSGVNIAGVQNDIIFDPALVNLAKSSDCVINAAIGPNQPGCDDDPQTAPCKTLQRNLAACPAAAGCPEGSDGMMRFRAILLSTANVNTIPDGVLYTCTFKVTGGTGTAVLENLNFGSSDPDGNAVTTNGCNGKVVIGGAPPPETATPTETPTEEEEEPTVTPVPPTNTPVPVATATATVSAEEEDDDGCQIATSGQSGAGWLLLVPLAGLLWFRRRSR
jgi:MYXO-CTERM domain-containing protein